MSDYILFTPVGKTDPIANARDGAMLHICRVFKPKCVYMYMSKEVIELHRKDNRYLYCLNKLKELMNIDIRFVIIERENLVKVNDFEIFYDLFLEELKAIRKEYKEETIILNISSGTPAMKGALGFISSIKNDNYLAIQVPHPNEEMSKRIEDINNYYVEIQWENNDDNDEKKFKNRCDEYNGDKLIALVKKETIREHIKKYDYCAALAIANEIKNELTNRSYKLLELAICRLQLNLKTIIKEQDKVNLTIVPSDTKEIKIFEYALWLKAKVERKDYADFIRGITPIIMDVYEIFLLNIYNIDITKYYDDKRKRFNKTKLNKDIIGQRIIDILNDSFKKDGVDTQKAEDSYNFGGDVYSKALYYIIKGLDNEESSIDNNRYMSFLKAAEYLSIIESKIRNKVAHEIISVTYDLVEGVNYSNITEKVTPYKIFERIKTIVSISCPSINSEMWNSYNIMNDEILKEINIKRETL